MTANASLVLANMRVVCNAKQRFIGSAEVSSSSGFAFVASIQSASPAHCVLADGVAQEEKSIHAKIIAALGLEVVSRINFAVNFLVELVDE